MKRIYFFLLIFVIFAQIPTFKASAVTSFKPGERITYNAYFNIGFVWLQAARVDFTVRNGIYNGHPAYHFVAAGRTLKTFARFYQVYDTLYSYADKQTLYPYFYQRVAHEDNYWAQDDFYFDQVTPQSTTVRTHCYRRNKDVKKQTLHLKGTVTDLVSALYRLREQNFSGLQLGQTIPFSIVYDDDGQKFDLNLRYLGKENITLKNGERYRCIKLRPKLIKGKVFRSEDAMTVWITDDENHIPVYVEAKIRVGSVKAYLASTSNLKQPNSSYLGKKK